MTVAIAQQGISVSSRSERVISDFLARADIRIGGAREHDLRVHDDRLFGEVMSRGSLGLGEAYMAGWWDAPRVDDFLDRILRAKLEHSIKPWNLIFLRLASKFINMQDKVRCRRVVVEHYDLSNDFYAKMLDPNYMQYTCAFWAHAKTLQEAQEHKLDQICRKLQLHRGEKVLELGCGFGGFAKFAAEHYGVEVTGYNISKEQVAWGRSWTKDLPVTIIERDYRTARGTFDKIVSVGLCEHVGYKNYRLLMQVAHRCLKPHGLFLLHCIGGNVSTVHTDPWLERYIFPGSVMPSAEQMSQAFQGLFVMEDWHNFGADYDKTCIAWYENFDRNWPLFREEYGERFYRMWKYYLLLCAASFRARKNQNWEIVLSKGGALGGYLRDFSTNGDSYSCP